LKALVKAFERLHNVRDWNSSTVGRFDHLVCDFLFAAPNIPRLESAVLFQHNVETTIWQRHAETLPESLFRPASG